MPFLPDLFTKLNNMVTAAADFLKGLGARASRRFTRIREYVVQKEPFRGGKRLVVIGLGGLCILLLFALIAVLVVMNHTADAGPRTAADEHRVFPGAPVPPEELFLPDEPDFLPGVTLERDRRQSWSAEDAEPHWQDPLKNGEEPWRERVEAVIDELLEHVP
jgi:hypothetical protein